MSIFTKREPRALARSGMGMLLLWITLCVLGRLVIHVPNATPLTSLFLLAPAVFSKRLSLLITVIALFLSDVALHFIFNFAIFGSWTVFAYSGWIATTLFGFYYAKKATFSRGIIFSGLSAILFWIVTNFGTWCETTLYAHTANGLLACYIAALPFLRNGLLGAIIWTSVFYFLIRLKIDSSVTTTSIGTSQCSETN